MSIINDALKKVQFNMNHYSYSNKVSTPQAQNPQVQQSWDHKNGLLWGITLMIGLAVLGCATLIIFIVSASRQTKVASVRKTSPATTNVREIVNMISNSPSAATGQDQADVLILNGIIFSDTEQLALINNQILKAGDYIEGKRVLSISSDKVELFDKGEVITLSTKH